MESWSIAVATRCMLILNKLINNEPCQGASCLSKALCKQCFVCILTYGRYLCGSISVVTEHSVCSSEVQKGGFRHFKTYLVLTLPLLQKLLKMGFHNESILGKKDNHTKNNLLGWLFSMAHLLQYFAMQRKNKSTEITRELNSGVLLEGKCNHVIPLPYHIGTCIM